MKKIAVICSILTLVLFPLHILAATLPDYEQEAELVAKALCEANSVRIQQYDAEQYQIIVVTTKNTLFYMLKTGNTESFFLKHGSAMSEADHAKWDDELLNDSPSAYYLLHGGPSDCVVTPK